MALSDKIGREDAERDYYKKLLPVIHVSAALFRNMDMAFLKRQAESTRFVLSKFDTSILFIRKIPHPWKPDSLAEFSGGKMGRGRRHRSATHRGEH